MNSSLYDRCIDFVGCSILSYDIFETAGTNIPTSDVTGSSVCLRLILSSLQMELKTGWQLSELASSGHLVEYVRTCCREIKQLFRSPFRVTAWRSIVPLLRETGSNYSQRLFSRKLPGSRWGKMRVPRRGCSVYNEITGTYLSDKLPDHAVPAARFLQVLFAVFSVLHDPQLVWKFVRKYFTGRTKQHFFRGTFSIIDSARERGFVTSPKLSRVGLTSANSARDKSDSCLYDYSRTSRPGLVSIDN